MQTYLDFEKPIQELDLKIEELKSKNLEFPSEDILKEILPGKIIKIKKFLRFKVGEGV